MKYIITWVAKGNEGSHNCHIIVSEFSLQGRLNSIANNDGGLGGAWGNSDIKCYELGKEVKIEISTTAKIV